jgi:hypothetical protein
MYILGKSAHLRGSKLAVVVLQDRPVKRRLRWLPVDCPGLMGSSDWLKTKNTNQSKSFAGSKGKNGSI